MATVELWFTIENRKWDLCPHNIDRMHGHAIQDISGMAPPVNVQLNSPISGATRTIQMFRPFGDNSGGVWEPKDALIYRRYTANWSTPDDRKVNPWDLNEPNPTDSGTMGTIPGPTIECNVGDKVVVHFKNLDNRSAKHITARTHSLHPHGIVFDPKYDGAYPLSPPDTTQSISVAERPLWDAVGVTGNFKIGDRVPPGGTFTYTWDTFGWPSTSGVWHYHDHSLCDAENVGLGALGFLVIHNPGDPDDVVNQDLPNGDPNGSLIRWNCINFPIPFPLLELDLVKARRVELDEGRIKTPEIFSEQDLTKFESIIDDIKKSEKSAASKKKAARVDISKDILVLERDNDLFEIDPDALVIRRICFPKFNDPPQAATYLQYYHEFPGSGMTINGRKFLGNTPTLIAGPGTKMRFGLAAMNANTFHTFHLHGHRWVIPGPDGNNAGAIQSSTQVKAVSQFEDTRIFGPANSFSFTINQGSFMGSRFTPDPTRAPGLGEWHMHCHVLHHMMPDGMMGSLLVINGGEFAFSALARLPKGMPCITTDEDASPSEIEVIGNAFNPNSIAVPSGTDVTFHFNEAFHTVTTSAGSDHPLEINQSDGSGTNPANLGNDVTLGTSVTRTIGGVSGDVIQYHCGIHGLPMSGTITII